MYSVVLERSGKESGERVRGDSERVIRMECVMRRSEQEESGILWNSFCHGSLLWHMFRSQNCEILIKISVRYLDCL